MPILLNSWAHRPYLLGSQSFPFWVFSPQRQLPGPLFTDTPAGRGQAPSHFPVGPALHAADPLLCQKGCALFFITSHPQFQWLLRPQSLFLFLPRKTTFFSIYKLLCSLPEGFYPGGRLLIYFNRSGKDLDSHGVSSPAWLTTCGVFWWPQSGQWEFVARWPM